ncbi:MAG: NAD(P)/FAD-dependent oxidoreductase [Verrucomicrobiaceae bacterium]
MRGITIVGGGLAGLGLGIALRRRGVPVLILEAGSYPRHKVCGEFVNGVRRETLSALGIEGIFESCLEHEWTRWWIDGKEVMSRRMSRPALGMSRWEMDELLREMFEKLGGELLINERVTPEARDGMVWTAGRRLSKESDWLGLKVHFEGMPPMDGLEMHLGDGGYVGLTPVSRSGERVNVCGLFRRRDCRGREILFDYLRSCRLDSLAERLKKGRMDESSITGVVGLQPGLQERAEGMCCLGDADRIIPPFTGNGMSMAFEAAECAIDPLMGYVEETISWEVCRARIDLELERRFRRRMKLAGGLHHVLLNGKGRGALSLAARMGMLPFDWLHRQLT